LKLIECGPAGVAENIWITVAIQFSDNPYIMISVYCRNKHLTLHLRPEQGGGDARQIVSSQRRTHTFVLETLPETGRVTPTRRSSPLSHVSFFLVWSDRRSEFVSEVAARGGRSTVTAPSGELVSAVAAAPLSRGYGLPVRGGASEVRRVRGDGGWPGSGWWRGSIFR
jgi:hypothetical protein